MSQIDEMLKLYRYNIYNNEYICHEDLKYLAALFSEEIDLSTYLRFEKFSSKFCWKNYILIIDNMEYPQKLKGLPYLFELLQDNNWPVFNETIDALMRFDIEYLIPNIEKYLNQAFEEKDEMWISGICTLLPELFICGKGQKAELNVKIAFKSY